MYNNEPLERVGSFKYLGLEFPSNHRRNEYVTCHLDAGKREGIMHLRTHASMEHFSTL